MAKNITLKDVYEVVQRLEDKMDGKFDKLDEEVKENTNFKNQLIGKMTVIFAIIGISVNMVWDYIFNK